MSSVLRWPRSQRNQATAAASNTNIVANMKISRLKPQTLMISAGLFLHKSNGAMPQPTKKTATGREFDSFDDPIRQ